MTNDSVLTNRIKKTEGVTRGDIPLPAEAGTNLLVICVLKKTVVTGCLEDTSAPTMGETFYEGVVLTGLPTTYSNPEGEEPGVRVADLPDYPRVSLQGSREDVFSYPGGLLEVSDRQRGGKRVLPTLEQTSTPR